MYHRTKGKDMPITYGIETYEIAELTAPMWDACGIECPAMIGGMCPRNTRDSKTQKWLVCPGQSSKFKNAAAEVVFGWSLESFQDEECGDAEYGGGWFGLFRTPKDAKSSNHPMGAGVILCVLSSGATQLTRFDTEEELTRDWAKIVSETETEEEES